MTRFKISLIAAAALASLGWVTVSFAQGSSLPSCTRDIWTCGDWSACDSRGEQSRKCVLTYECTEAETPMPPTKQACSGGTAPAPATSPTPSPAPAPATSPTPSPAPTSAPTTTQAQIAPEGCTHDTWVCADWPPCDPNGMQKRNCQITLECRAIQTPPPQTERVCPMLQCGNLQTLAERVACRLRLAPAGLAREYEIEYLPELCRARTDRAAREACVRLYRSFEPCWGLVVGSDRNACAGQILNLVPSVGARRTACDEKSETDRPACMEVLRSDVYGMIQFRMHDLAVRAKALAERDVPLELIADFAVKVEEQQIAFDQATDKAGRKKAILDLQLAWKDFIVRAKLYLQ